MVWSTFLPILVFMVVFILNLWANTCQMHHMTFELGGRGFCC